MNETLTKMIDEAVKLFREIESAWEELRVASKALSELDIPEVRRHKKAADNNLLLNDRYEACVKGINSYMQEHAERLLRDAGLPHLDDIDNARGIECRVRNGLDPLGGKPTGAEDDDA